MIAATWIAVVVLGFGSIGVFVFFLRDLSKVFPKRPKRSNEDGDPHQ
jgi:hypothetical protein